MNNRVHHVEAVTPIFSYGADQNQPEIRAASIRGQLHQWFRLLGGSFEQERAIFGGIKLTGQESSVERTSSIVIRVETPNFEPIDKPRLPHHKQKKAFAASVPAGTKFKVHVFERRQLEEKQRQLLERSLNCWLLAGALGTRANRGGGSLRCLDQSPRTTEEWYQMMANVVGSQSQLRYGISKAFFPSAEKARCAISDTLDGNNIPVVGKVFGCIHPGRRSSPLKLRVTKLHDNDFRIVAVVDCRPKVTGVTNQNIQAAIDCHRKHYQPKSIGEILNNMSWVSPS
ncbi:MAG: hypothetical protein E1N59_1113 [Puniceicoccaceae bacterium 5H]|nr:MAG: hypothetical protein E1N59_1113 [Puniceicoccaceae bacterium 5H]